MAFLTYKFLANGTIDGVITVDSTQYFRANQLVTVFADNRPTLSLEVKKIISNIQLAVGPITLLETDDVRSDLSAYTVIANAAILQRGIFLDAAGNFVTTTNVEDKRGLDVNVINTEQRTTVEWITKTQFDAGNKINTETAGSNENALVRLTPAALNIDNIPYANPGDYAYDLAKLEIAGGLAQLLWTPPVVGSGDFNYNNPVQYTYDPTKIDVSGGVAKLFYTAVIAGFGNFDYNTPAQYTYDPAKVVVAGGLAELLLQPATEIYFVDWNYTTPASYTYDATKIGVAGGLASPLAGAFCYAHWRLNETVGTAVADSSGNARNGIATSGLSWVAGKINNCGSFNGTSGYINCGDICSFERTQTFSIEAWFKTASSAVQIIAGRCINTGTLRGYLCYLQANTVVFLMDNDNPGGNYIRIHTNATFADNNWHHVVFTYNGTSLASGMHIYIDNVDQACTIDKDSLSATIITATNFEIGAYSGANGLFVGLIDEVVVYNRVLSASEVTTRYNAGTGTEALTFHPVITPNVGLTSGVPIATWDNYIETATKGAGDEIKYILSDDDGVTWKYWNGSAFVASDTTYQQANTATIIQTNFNSFPKVNNKLLQRAFFHSGGTIPAMSLDLVQIDYSPTAKYDTTNPTVIANYNISDSPLIQFNLLTETSTKPSGTNLKYTLSADDSITWLYWSGSAWGISDGMYAQSNDVATINAHIATFSVVNKKVRIKAFLNSDGGNTPLLDNIKIDYSKYLSHYPTDNPTIDADYNVSDSPLVQWSAYTETATAPAGTNIKYTLSNDDSATWQYWNGSAWVIASGAYSQSNTVSEIQAHISTFPTTNSKIRIRAFLNNSADATPQLDNIKIDYTKIFGFYPTDDNLYITTTNASHIDPAVVLSWLSTIFSVSILAGTSIKVILSVNGRVSWLTWNGVAWVTVVNPNSVIEAVDYTTIQTNFATLPLGDGMLDVRVFLKTTDPTKTPQILNIQITSSTGYNLTGSWETQVYNSAYFDNDWLKTYFTTVVPVGTTAIFKYRTGNYVADLSAYTIFNSGDEPLLNGKYIQFKVDFTSNGLDTPIFSWLQTAYKIYSLQSVRP